MMEFLSKIDKYRLCAKASSIEVLTGELAEKVDSMLPNTQLLYLGNESNGCPVDNCIVSAYKFADGEHLIECLDIVNKKQYVKTHADADWGSPIGGADAAISNIEFKVTQDGVNAVKLEVLQDGTSAGAYQIVGSGSASVYQDPADTSKIIIKTPEYSNSPGAKIKYGRYNGAGEDVELTFDFYPVMIAVSDETGETRTCVRGQTANNSLSITWNEKTVIFANGLNASGKKYFYCATGVETLETEGSEVSTTDPLVELNAAGPFIEGDIVNFTVNDETVRTEHISVTDEVDQTNVPVAGGNKQFYFTMPKNNVIIDIEDKTLVEENVTVNGNGMSYTFNPAEARTNDNITLTISNTDTNNYDYYINGDYGTSKSFKYKQVNTFTLTREEIEDPVIPPADPEEPEECSHEWGNGVITTVATCKTLGVKTFTCSKCGETKTESINIDPNNHENKTTTPQTDPTCGTTGESEKWSCSACGQSGGGGVIPATGNHIYTDDQDEICNECGHNRGHIHADPDTIDWIPDQNNHCCHKICPSCGEEIASKSHDWGTGWTVTTQPTCTETGWQTRTCKDCGDTEGESILMVAHTPGSWETKVEATCEEQGWKEQRCTVCSKLLDEDTIAALGHIEETVKGYAATCTEPGLTDGVKCSRCSAILVEQTEIDALEHDYSDTVIKPTCTAMGYTLHTCDRCGEEYTDNDTQALGHNEISNNDGVKPTCTTTGWTDSTKCSRCGQSLSNRTLIDTIDHDYTDSNDGIMYCSMCGKLDPSHTHSLTTTESKAATCTEGGYVTQTCLCGHVEKTTINALGHTDVDGSAKEYNEDATCTTDGTYSVYCGRCGKELDPIEKPNSKLGHDWSDWSIWEEDTDLAVRTCRRAGCDAVEYAAKEEVIN